MINEHFLGIHWENWKHESGVGLMSSTGRCESLHGSPTSLFRQPNATRNSIHGVHAEECGRISHSSSMAGPGSTFSAALLNWTRGRVVAGMHLDFENMLPNWREGFQRNWGLKGFSKSSTRSQVMMVWRFVEFSCGLRANENITSCPGIGKQSTTGWCDVDLGEEVDFPIPACYKDDSL